MEQAPPFLRPDGSKRAELERGMSSGRLALQVIRWNTGFLPMKWKEMHFFQI